MGHQIIGLHDWLQTPPGQYLLRWEQTELDRTVADFFGYHALQLGLPELSGLRANRMPHRWLAVSDATSGRPGAAVIVTHPCALPFPENSLDLVLLPHTLELSPDPHAALREVHRVLVPEGRVVVCGLNPNSLWGLRQRRGQVYQQLGWGQLFMPEAKDLIAHWRLRDWLRLLGFEVESARFGAHRPALSNALWLERFAWMDAAGDRWWPIFGGVYFLVAAKKVHGMRLLSAPWKTRKSLATAPVPVASPAQHHHKQHEPD